MNKYGAILFCVLSAAALFLPVRAVVSDMAAAEAVVETAGQGAGAAAGDVSVAATRGVIVAATVIELTGESSETELPEMEPLETPARTESQTARVDLAAADIGGAGTPSGTPARAERNLPPENIVITVNAVGDCTIGYDETFGYEGRFDQVYETVGGDAAYFFSNVADIFARGDLTVANLENVFTTSAKKADKTFRFKAPPEYVRILEAGGIDAVNIANNHVYDYLQQGFDDTVATLEASEVGYFGYDVTKIMDVKGVRVGLAGFHIGGGGWSHREKSINAALETLNAEADIVIMSMHWGLEGQYQPTGDQRALARYLIDNGADLVVGHHPHTLQGVETYEGRTIAYSLGNFCFGGNRNPKDKDTVILRQSFEFDEENLELIGVPEPEIIPASVSSERGRNDYRPTPVDGEDAARVLKKIADGV